MPSASNHADLMAYDDYCARIYDDRRMPPETRQLALAIAWVLMRDPLYRRQRTSTKNGQLLWTRVATILERPRWQRLPGGGSYYRYLLKADLPRYESPFAGTYAGACVAPMIRRSGECGQSSSFSVIDVDPVTGWDRRIWWYCRRHVTVGEQMQRQLASMIRPEPIPNRGGLLPCYFRSAWEDIYSWASDQWKPPYHGLVADEWPHAEEEAVPRPPRLLVLPGGGGLAEPQEGQ